jgi:hypothetical protein
MIFDILTAATTGIFDVVTAAVKCVTATGNDILLLSLVVSLFFTGIGVFHAFRHQR